jgi:hypothetical protein
MYILLFLQVAMQNILLSLSRAFIVLTTGNSISTGVLPMRTLRVSIVTDDQNFHILVEFTSALLTYDTSSTLKLWLIDIMSISPSSHVLLGDLLVSGFRSCCPLTMPKTL